ncbi:hypothetical protein NOC27_1261 [Nitrosococcus oceani AFC27]|nr:sulfotransferase domain-containing protein [Nitrosococcus oceani]EDZ67934.1 hypothetical protein NOC27_1261 [Nitrosococcus oceani AFC27]KFI19130.1 hypothetical protein IB75_10430 [Nitrosococcus oceani C-27]GEM18810.1 sulfotransferase family protein [Nitrosococcus oceani]
MKSHSRFSPALAKVEHRTFLLRKKAYQTLFLSPSCKAVKQVIFIAGVQRSGTNMLMDVFERDYETVVYHERDKRAFDSYEMRSREVIHRLVKESSAQHVVLKALCELQELRHLLDEFMPSKGVWLVRSYEDVVNSHLALWTGMPESIRRIVQDRNTAGWRGRGMSGKTHALIRSLYHPGISNASACALFWYFRNILFFEQNLDQDSRVRLVCYEQLVQRPAEILNELFAFLGITYTPRVSRKVVASSVRRKPPPEIDSAILEVCDELSTRMKRLTG